MLLVLALLFILVSYTLYAILNYPEILLDKASFAKSLLAPIFFVLTEVAAPLLLLFWILIVAREYRVYSVLGMLGLLLVLLRSLVWELNAILPIASGFYGTAGIMNIFAVLGESLWLFWLLLFGFRLLIRRTAAVVSIPLAENAKEDQGQVMRRRFLKAAAALGVGLAGVAFVGARTALTITDSPALEGDDVPSEPSFIGTLLYLLVMIYQRLHPINTVAQELAITHDKLPLPSDVLLESVNAYGVPEYLRIRASFTFQHKPFTH